MSNRINDAVNAGRAYLLGVRDGWQQPRSITLSANVEHLITPHCDAREWHDAGINLGQWLRLGPRSESALEGFPVWPRRGTDDNDGHTER